jgi:HSP20 family molecular chaperone IbpA
MVANSSSSKQCATTMTSFSSTKSSSNAANHVPITLRENFFNDNFFRNSWEDFDSLKQEMANKSHIFWKRADDQMKSMVSSSSSAMQSKKQQQSSFSSSDSRTAGNNADFMRSDSITAPSLFFPRRWMSTMPNVDFDKDLFNDKMKSLNLFPEQKDDQVIRMKDDDSKFELSLNTHGYRPDEIKVNVAGGCLSVDAKHEEKEEGKFVSRQFSRKYTLPEGCEAGKVNSNLSSDGILVISAPKRQAVKQEGNRSITVEVKKN